MRLKNKNIAPQGGFSFYFVGDGEVVVHVTGNSIPQLTEKARASMSNQGISIPENLPEIIEHQICLRQSNPTEACYSGGIGDDLHHKFIAPFLKSVASRVGGTASGSGFIAKARTAFASAVERVAECQSCKGTTVYKDGKKNLGRAGSLNNL